MDSKNIKLNQIEIKKIKSLINKGDSLNIITKKLGKSKTTVYYHFKKFKGTTVIPIKVNSNDANLIGEFIGLFAGDGCYIKTKKYQYKISLHFNKSEKKFTEDLIKNVLIPLFTKEPMIRIQENRLNLYYYSKNIYLLIDKYLDWNREFRKTYSIRLKTNNHSANFMKGFIRGSVDSDGHISKKKICFASVSERLIDNISLFLNKFNIKHSKYKYKEKIVKTFFIFIFQKIIIKNL